MKTSVFFDGAPSATITVVRFHEVGDSFLSEFDINGHFWIGGHFARVSRVLRVRGPQARHLKDTDLYFPTPCWKLKTVKINLLSYNHAYPL